MKWTDPEVVETLQFVQDLIDAGAFDKNAAGMTDNIAMTQFQQGEAAMVITGPWNIGTFEDPAETPVCDSIEVAKFPYFEEKPEFKNEDMQTLSPYMISGKTGRKRTGAYTGTRKNADRQRCSEEICRGSSLLDSENRH